MDKREMIPRKLKYASVGVGVLGVAAHDIYLVLVWVISQYAVPKDIAIALAHIGTGLLMSLAAFASGWLTREA